MRLYKTSNRLKTCGQPKLKCCQNQLIQKPYFVSMKYFFAILFLIGITACTNEPAQNDTRPKLVTKDSAIKNQNINPYVSVDVSPMDMSYWPDDYTKVSVKKPLPVARVIYSRPHKQGRKVFGTLLKYEEPWRLGANEATEIEFFQPVTIQNKKIPKGKYILYCIPHKDKWTIIFNSNLNSWGLNLDAKKDLFQFDIPISIMKNQSIEYFSMIFTETPTGADLIMAWDDVESRMSIEYSDK